VSAAAPCKANTISATLEAPTCLVDNRPRDVAETVAVLAALSPRPVFPGPLLRVGGGVIGSLGCRPHCLRDVVR